MKSVEVEIPSMKGRPFCLVFILLFGVELLGFETLPAQQQPPPPAPTVNTPTASQAKNPPNSGNSGTPSSESLEKSLQALQAILQKLQDRAQEEQQAADSLQNSTSPAILEAQRETQLKALQKLAGVPAPSDHFQSARGGTAAEASSFHSAPLFNASPQQTEGPPGQNEQNAPKIPRIVPLQNLPPASASQPTSPGSSMENSPSTRSNNSFPLSPRNLAVPTAVPANKTGSDFLDTVAALKRSSDQANQDKSIQETKDRALLLRYHEALQRLKTIARKLLNASNSLPVLSDIKIQQGKLMNLGDCSVIHPEEGTTPFCSELATLYIMLDDARARMSAYLQSPSMDNTDDMEKVADELSPSSLAAVQKILKQVDDFVSKNTAQGESLCQQLVSLGGAQSGLGKILSEKDRQRLYTSFQTSYQALKEKHPDLAGQAHICAEAEATGFQPSTTLENSQTQNSKQTSTIDPALIKAAGSQINNLIAGQIAEMNTVSASSVHDYTPSLAESAYGCPALTPEEEKAIAQCQDPKCLKSVALTWNTTHGEVLQSLTNLSLISHASSLIQGLSNTVNSFRFTLFGMGLKPLAQAFLQTCLPKLTETAEGIQDFVSCLGGTLTRNGQVGNPWTNINLPDWLEKGLGITIFGFGPTNPSSAVQAIRQSTQVLLKGFSPQTLSSTLEQRMGGITSLISKWEALRRLYVTLLESSYEPILEKIVQKSFFQTLASDEATQKTQMCLFYLARLMRDDLTALGKTSLGQDELDNLEKSAFQNLPPASSLDRYRQLAGSVQTHSSAQDLDNILSFFTIMPTADTPTETDSLKALLNLLKRSDFKAWFGSLYVFFQYAINEKVCERENSGSTPSSGSVAVTLRLTPLLYDTYQEAVKQVMPKFANETPGVQEDIRRLIVSAVIQGDLTKDFWNRYRGYTLPVENDPTPLDMPCADSRWIGCLPAVNIQPYCTSVSALENVCEQQTGWGEANKPAAKCSSCDGNNLCGKFTQENYDRVSMQCSANPTGEQCTRLAQCDNCNKVVCDPVRKKYEQCLQDYRKSHNCPVYDPSCQRRFDECRWSDMDYLENSWFREASLPASRTEFFPELNLDRAGDWKKNLTDPFQTFLDYKGPEDSETRYESMNGSIRGMADALKGFFALLAQDGNSADRQAVSKIASTLWTQVSGGDHRWEPWYFLKLPADQRQQFCSIFSPSASLKSALKK